MLEVCVTQFYERSFALLISSAAFAAAVDDNEGNFFDWKLPNEFVASGCKMNGAGYMPGLICVNAVAIQQHYFLFVDGLKKICVTDFRSPIAVPSQSAE